jgi:hypothetical protein
VSVVLYSAILISMMEYSVVFAGVEAQVGIPLSREKTTKSTLWVLL